MNSMSYVDKKALFCQCMLLSVNVMGFFEFVSIYGIARKEVFLLN